MTYQEWIEQHNLQMKVILSKLQEQGITDIPDIINYFKYENMRVTEPDFCPLYKDNIKCHNVDNLNCYYCACPHFVVNHNPSTHGKVTIVSVCGINSRFKSEYYENPDENNIVNIHCDCSNCFIPHKPSYVKAALKHELKNYTKLKDCTSILEYLRYNQIKWKC
jgi:hypothetical protein